MRAKRHLCVFGLITRDFESCARRSEVSSGKETRNPWSSVATLTPKVGVGNSLLYRLRERVVPRDNAQSARIFYRDGAELAKRRARTVGLGLHRIKQGRRRATGAHPRARASHSSVSLIFVFSFEKSYAIFSIIPNFWNYE